jgi:integrase/recombinase XerD
MATLGKPKKHRLVPRAIPKPTLRRLFDAIKAGALAGNLLAARDYAMFRLCYDCGLRGSELSHLRIDDVDMERQAVKVHGKGDDERVTFFGSKTACALRSWLAIIHPGCQWLFPSNSHQAGFRPLTRNGVYQALLRWCDAAKIERLRLHDLRHSYARHALRRGIDLEMVQRQLGHKDISSTMIYSKSEDEDRREVHLRLSPGDDI